VDASPRVTEPFRQKHSEIHEHLTHIDGMAGNLDGQSAGMQRETMARIVKFFKTHILAHAASEEKVLYPIVDRFAGVGVGGSTFTSSMRYEHRVVERWINELERMAAAATPDARAFARRADNLLGLINAHFEEEEEILLPILEAKMTPEQFQKEIMSHMAH